MIIKFSIAQVDWPPERMRKILPLRRAATGMALATMGALSAAGAASGAAAQPGS
jgi:hypothetical protein